MPSQSSTCIGAPKCTSCCKIYNNQYIITWAAFPEILAKFLSSVHKPIEVFQLALIKVNKELLTFFNENLVYQNIDAKIF